MIRPQAVPRLLARSRSALFELLSVHRLQVVSKGSSEFSKHQPPRRARIGTHHPPRKQLTRPLRGPRRQTQKGAYRMITISAFEWVPELARGLVRDLRVRWALEEAGLPYRTRLLKFGDQDKPDYRALQPFGQVPIFEEDGLVLFESGAIVLHIGARSEALLPSDAG